MHQRADKHNVMGPPKSRAGTRTVPLPPGVVDALRHWKLICPQHDGRLSLVFPNGSGNVENHSNIAHRGLAPIMIKAGIVKPILDEHGIPKRDADGKPLVEPKYSMHCLRHFLHRGASIESRMAASSFPPKSFKNVSATQSIVITMDRYSHLFPRNEDSNELAVAEKALLG